MVGELYNLKETGMIICIFIYFDITINKHMYQNQATEIQNAINQHQALSYSCAEGAETKMILPKRSTDNRSAKIKCITLGELY